MKNISGFLDFIYEEVNKKHPYFKGLSVSTAAAKKRKMKKQAKMRDDDPSAYKPLPGDEAGKKHLKKSKHTQRYEEMFLDESLATAKKRFLEKGVIDKSLFNRLKEIDPSRTYKYLDKIIEFYLKDVPDYSELKDVIHAFHTLSMKNQIEITDINAYRTFDDIQRVVKSSGLSYKSKLRKRDVDVVYSDNKYLVIIPRTHEASCKYGAGTKFCIASEIPTDYNSYIDRQATIYYIIDKRENIENRMYKLAVVVFPDGETECVDSKDSEMDFEEILYFTGLDVSIFKWIPPTQR